MDALSLAGLWTTWAALSTISIALSSQPSKVFQPAHLNLWFLRSSTTTTNTSAVGFVIAAVIYVAILQTFALKFVRSTAKAILTGFSLLLCEVVWEPEVFTAAERLFVFLPLYLNAWASWAVYSAPATTTISVPQWEGDSKADSESAPGNY